MNAPLFSVIIPTFNSAAELHGTLDSVLAQDEPLREIIVVDGASTDDTPRLLARYGDTVRWVSEADGGIYDAMNKGIRLSTGRFLYFLGAGDVLLPGVLAQIAPRMPSQSPAFVYGNVRMRETGAVHDGRWSRGKFARGNICHQAIFTERTLFDRFGPYQTRFRIWADCAFNMACFGDSHVHVQYLPDTIAEYEGAGFSVRAQDPAFERERAALIRKHLGTGAWLAFLAERSLSDGAKTRRHHLLQSLRRLITRTKTA